MRPTAVTLNMGVSYICEARSLGRPTLGHPPPKPSGKLQSDFPTSHGHGERLNIPPVP